MSVCKEDMHEWTEYNKLEKMGIVLKDIMDIDKQINGLRALKKKKESEAGQLWESIIEENRNGCMKEGREDEYC